MAKSPDVEDWLEELNAGLAYRRKHGVEDKWAKLEALFYNVEPSQDNSGPNIICATGDALLSQLTVPNPKYLLKPTTPDGVVKAKVTESVDNKLLYELMISKEIENMGLSAFLWGVGVGKIGFDSEWGFDDSHDLGGTKDPVGMTLTQFGLNGNRIEYNSIRPGMPWFKSVMPHDIVVPWGTKDLDSAPWIAHRVVRHIDDIKADPKYSGKRDLQPVMSMKDFVNSYKTVVKPYRIGQAIQQTHDETSGRSEYVEMWEVHERKTGKIYVIATGHSKFLRNDMDLLQINGLPFVDLSFVPRARTFWTTPDAYYLLQAQAELTDIAIHSSKQRRVSTLKMIIAGDAIDDEELTKLTSAEVGAVVRLKSGTRLNEAVTTFSPGFNPQIYQEQESVRRNARELVGFSANQSGEFTGGRKTAQEVATVQNASGLRMGRRMGNVKKTYIEAMKKINSVIFKFWQAPQVAKVVGEDGSEGWVQFDGASIEGDYSFDIQFSSEPEESYANRKMMALQLYQMMLANDPLADPLKVRQFIINEFNDVSFSSVWKPEVLSAARAIGGSLPGGSGNGLGSQPQGQLGAPTQIGLGPGAGDGQGAL